MLLLDEPTTFLDLRYQVELLDLVRDLADAGGVAVGLVLHDLDQAAAVADELVLLDEGRRAPHGPAAEVLDAVLLTEVYGIRVEVDHDPRTGAVRTRPVGRHAPRRPDPLTPPRKDRSLSHVLPSRGEPARSNTARSNTARLAAAGALAAGLRAPSRRPPHHRAAAAHDQPPSRARHPHRLARQGALARGAGHPVVGAGVERRGARWSSLGVDAGRGRRRQGLRHWVKAEPLDARSRTSACAASRASTLSPRCART